MLKAAFGSKIKNIARFRGKILLDHEQTIKDVCKGCNSSLSPYDNAGKKFIENLMTCYNAEHIDLPVDLYSINWFLKTHLNHMRIIPDKETGLNYNISHEIYKNIRYKLYPSSELCKLYIEGWKGAKYFWDENSNRKIEFFSYKSVKFRSQNIIVSNFRIKCINTFFFFPVQENYISFGSRVSSVLLEMKQNLNFNLQEIDLSNTTNDFVKITKLVPKGELINKFIRYKT